jgi:hypothetical protein
MLERLVLEQLAGRLVHIRRVRRLATIGASVAWQPKAPRPALARPLGPALGRLTGFVVLVVLVTVSPVTRLVGGVVASMAGGLLVAPMRLVIAVTGAFVLAVRRLEIASVRVVARRSVAPPGLLMLRIVLIVARRSRRLARFFPRLFRRVSEQAPGRLVRRIRHQALPRSSGSWHMAPTVLRIPRRPAERILAAAPPYAPSSRRPWNTRRSRDRRATCKTWLARRRFATPPCRFSGPIDSRASGGTMNDNEVQDHIEALVAEERRLYAAAEREGGHTIEERARLEEIRVALDRYWDLLRQRRAEEEFGLDPDQTILRSARTVEHFEQ